MEYTSGQEDTFEAAVLEIQARALQGWELHTLFWDGDYFSFVLEREPDDE